MGTRGAPTYAQYRDYLIYINKLAGRNIHIYTVRGAEELNILHVCISCPNLTITNWMLLLKPTGEAT